MTVGDEEAEEALLACLAKGADRAIRIWDEASADPEPLLIARSWPPRSSEESPDLVLCGVQSSDAASAPPASRWPRTSICRGWRSFDAWTQPGGRHRPVERELEGGLVEELRFPRRRC